jgi:hypothetical protein
MSLAICTLDMAATWPLISAGWVGGTRQNNFELYREGLWGEGT